MVAAPSAKLVQFDANRHSASLKDRPAEKIRTAVYS